VVIAGFQGVSEKKEVTTLGRGGSDTTAVAMAAALDAEYCEICSDVDGVYSADPHIVAAARRIGELSYEETQEMAEAGARVLNAQAVEFAKAKGIAILARATEGPLPGPDPSVDGTVVRKAPPRTPGTVVGVASERDILLLNADVPAGDLLALLDARGVAAKQLHISGERTQVAVSRANLHDEAHLREALTARFNDRARLIDGLAAVSVIGAGINATHANVRAGTDMLALEGITPVATATSSFRITWMVPRDRVDEAVRLLHQRFIESGVAPLP
jgi:aspartate kinase